MEENINIAEILKDKQKGIRLYSPIFGECAFCCVSKDTNEIFVKKHNGLIDYFNSEGLYFALGEVMLFPSKEMHDWEKLSWKKGDILVSNDNDSHIIFEGFSKDDYTTFEGKYWINVSKKRYVSYLYMQKTQNYHIEYDKDATQTYINTIEEIFGVKLNRETLEIEKQPEFKDGDIVVYGKSVAICRKICKHTLFPYVSIDETSILLFNDNPNVSPDECRLATEEEKQQLFEALAKEGKIWNAEKKQVVDLKIKWMALKPFDKVITRNAYDDIWTANIFSHMNSYGEYVAIGCVGGYHYCLPYNEETAHLLGTTDEWEGGEG